MYEPLLFKWDFARCWCFKFVFFKIIFPSSLTSSQILLWWLPLSLTSTPYYIIQTNIPSIIIILDYTFIFPVFSIAFFQFLTPLMVSFIFFPRPYIRSFSKLFKVSLRSRFLSRTHSQSSSYSSPSPTSWHPQKREIYNDNSFGTRNTHHVCTVTFLTIFWRKIK